MVGRVRVGVKRARSVDSCSTKRAKVDGTIESPYSPSVVVCSTAVVDRLSDWRVTGVVDASWAGSSNATMSELDIGSPLIVARGANSALSVVVPTASRGGESTDFEDGSVAAADRKSDDKSNDETVGAVVDGPQADVGSKDAVEVRTSVRKNENDLDLTESGVGVRMSNGCDSNAAKMEGFGVGRGQDVRWVARNNVGRGYRTLVPRATGSFPADCLGSDGTQEIGKPTDRGSIGQYGDGTGFAGSGLHWGRSYGAASVGSAQESSFWTSLNTNGSWDFFGVDIGSEFPEYDNSSWSMTDGYGSDVVVDLPAAYEYGGYGMMAEDHHCMWAFCGMNAPGEGVGSAVLRCNGEEYVAGGFTTARDVQANGYEQNGNWRV